VVLLARIRGRGGYLNQATVSAIAWTLSDATLGTVLTSGTFPAASVVFNGLQLDYTWTKDQTGYNFSAVIQAANMPLANSGDRMAADVKFTMVGGEVMRVQWNFPTLQVYG
jgi:hypothetical protein